jgi:hypothetical protein
MAKASPEVRSVIKAILKLPGDKMLTVITPITPPQTFDVSEKGVFGYHRSHKQLFEKLLQQAITGGGGLVIRQFLPLKVERTTPEGKKIWIPRKNIYGIALGNGAYMPLSASQIRSACCTDAETGKPLPPENDVSYLAFPSIEPA